jgi:polysaccharide chain length determinant protein (PEP-CTERM system associated)
MEILTMRRINLNGLQDVMALLVRRKWWIIYPFLALSSAALLLTYMLPRLYESRALVLIQSRDVPNDFVKDLLAASAAQRLNTIQQTVLSRTNLLEILTEFRDSLPEYNSMNIDEQIANLRDRIGLAFNTAGGGGEGPTTVSFTIAYSNRSPQVAQKITEKVTSVFIKQDSQARESKIGGSVSFLKDSLEKVSAQLEVSEEKKRNLKAAHRNEMPENLMTNLTMLGTLSEQRKGLQEQIDRLDRDKAQMERDLSTTEKTLQRPKPAVVGPPRNPLLDEYVAAQNELKALVGRGQTPSHPDMKLATNKLSNIKSQLTSEELASLDRKNEKSLVEQSSDETIPNPAYVNLVKQLENLEFELKIRRNNLKNADTQIERYTKFIQDAPQSEQQITDVLRENINLTKQYDDLKGKLDVAQLSEDLETRQQGAQFKIQDPANLPLVPTKPAKPAIAAAGIAFSLLFGIALAIIVDVANQKMWTLSDVESLLGTTVLVEIPEIVTLADLSAGRRKKQIHLVSAAAASALYGVCLYFAYVHQGFLMTQLEPVIRRLY